MPILALFAPLAAVSALHAPAHKPINVTVTAADRLQVRQAGKPVHALPRGVYVIVVHDASPNVGFDLLGPGIHRMTGDVWYGTQRWTVRLRRGAYAFRMRRAGSVDSGPKGEPVVGNPQAAVSVRVS